MAQHTDAGGPAATDLAAALDWIRQANTRLTTLQNECEKLKELSPSVAATLDWIRGAEHHLAALQVAFDRLQPLVEQHDEQVPRLIARVTLLESRLTDLERATHAPGEPLD